MGAFDEIIKAAMKHDGAGEVELDVVPPNKRMDDTKTPQQKQRDRKNITQSGTRPELPADTIDPDSTPENRVIPPEYIMEFLQSQKKDRKA